MTLQANLKRLYEDEHLYVVWPYQQKTLHDIWGAIEELSRIAEGTDENQLENTLRLIAHRFADVMGTIDERIPRDQVENGGVAPKTPIKERFLGLNPEGEKND